MLVNAGATIEEETGEMKVKEDTTSVAAHFFFKVQFLGFSGSSAPFHVTYQRNKVSCGLYGNGPIYDIYAPGSDP